MTGKLLVIDGPDGAGKTTATKFIIDHLASHEEDIGPTIVVNILSGCSDSLAIRSILTNPESNLSAHAELLAYAAAITNTMDNVVRPSLEKGINVLIDRGPFSNFCYQLQDINHPWFDIWSKVHSTTCADATLLLSVNQDKGLDRCAERSGALDKIEMRGSEWHKRVVDCYSMIFDIVNKQEASSVFSKIAGKAFFYENSGTISDLKNKCSEFVDFAFPN